MLTGTTVVKAPVQVVRVAEEHSTYTYDVPEAVDVPSIVTAPVVAVIVEGEGDASDEGPLQVDWSSGFFDFDVNMYPSALCSLFCPCIMCAQLSEFLNWARWWQVLTSLTLLLGLLVIIEIKVKANIFFVIWPVFFYLAWALRDRARSVLAIRGHVYDDCLLSLLAPPCSLAQVIRHVYSFGKKVEPWHCTRTGLSSQPTVVLPIHHHHHHRINPVE